MQEEFLRTRLEAGRSIESIAKEVGRHPSTVAYWVNKHGLVSPHAARHAARGPLAYSELLELVERGMSVREIAKETGRSAGSVRHWLRTYGLATRPSRYLRRDLPRPSAIVRECSKHGWTRFHAIGDKRYRCGLCNTEAVTERRRRVKGILVEEAGGACVMCGYDAYLGALQFHHVDPTQKRFHMSSQGVTRSLAKLREEAEKCLLVCANCHAEVEGGFKALPAPLP